MADRDSEHVEEEQRAARVERPLTIVGRRYIHTRTGNTYMAVGFCNMKNPETGEWQDAIIYMADPAPMVGKRDIYVREKKSFTEKFHLKQ